MDLICHPVLFNVTGQQSTPFSQAQPREGRGQMEAFGMTAVMPETWPPCERMGIAIGPILTLIAGKRVLSTLIC